MQLVELVGEVEEGVLHAGVVAGRALEVLQLVVEAVGRVQPSLGRHRPPLGEVSLVAEDNPRHLGSDH